ncbi:TPA: hypothetical protein ACNOIS_000936 [Klebsiella oxytoca]
MLEPASLIAYSAPVIKTAVTSYNSRKTIATLIFKAVSLAVDSRVAVTGLPGSGKSYLFAALNQELRDKKMKRPGPSIKGEDEILFLGNGFLPKKITIIPGQKMAVSFSLMDKVINNKKLQGLMHILDYGYNVPRDKYSHENLKSMGIATFNQLQENNLNEELDYLEDIVDRLIQLEHRPNWFCLILNKVDLYKASDAIKHYTASPKFLSILNKLYTIFPAEKMALLVPVCCEMSTISYGKKDIHPMHVKDHAEISGMLHTLLNKIALIDC